MFFYIHILSYYELFLYFNLWLSVMLDSLYYAHLPPCPFWLINSIDKFQHPNTIQQIYYENNTQVWNYKNNRLNFPNFIILHILSDTIIHFHFFVEKKI